MTGATERVTADSIYDELASLIERRISELPEDNQDRHALEDCLHGLRLRCLPTGRSRDEDAS